MIVFNNFLNTDNDNNKKRKRESESVDSDSSKKLKLDSNFNNDFKNSDVYKEVDAKINLVETRSSDCNSKVADVLIRIQELENRLLKFIGDKKIDDSNITDLIEAGDAEVSVTLDKTDES